MKNKSFFLISAAVLLALSACGGKNNNSSKSSPSGPSGDGYIPAPYVDPEVNLSDVETPNMKINFANVEDTCMVNPKAKTYIDAMEEQEKTLDKPFHISSLYGPDDYASLAVASNSNNGANIPAANKGGVDVCEILDRNDYSNDCKNYPIKLQWNNGSVTFDSAKLKFWSTEDQSDLREVSLGANATSAELPNLFRARKYRVQLVAGDQVSNSFEFTTGDYPRTMTMGGVHNVRDIGGFVTSYGVRTNQGLIYRGYYIDDKTNGHGKNYDASVQAVQEEVMKIGVELDVQENSSTSGNYGRTSSCLNSSVTPCDYEIYTLVAYADFLQEKSYKNLPKIFELLANADEKHVYFHCHGGADRTGMLDFFVNAILGVSYTDLIEEFELTTQTNNKRCHMHNDQYAYFPKFLNAFVNDWADYDPEKTVNENCEKWLKEVAKVDSNDIEKVREIMLPGYAEGKLDVNERIPVYTPDESFWETDDVCHYQYALEDSNVKCNWGRHKVVDGVCTICDHGGEGDDQGEEDDNDFTKVKSHVWTVTKSENNSDGKQYQQIKDNNKNKVGVRILQSDISASSEGSFDSDNRLPTDGKSVTYKVKAPKAGTYQMVMNGRVADGKYKLSERGIVIKLNGVEVSIDGNNRDGGLGFQGDIDFVMCPSIRLTGNEDTITVACRTNGIGFNPTAYLVFAEH